MKYKTIIYLLLINLSLITSSYTPNSLKGDFIKILQDAEKYRVPWASMSLNAVIENDNEKELQHFYRIFYKDDKTLISFLKSDEERGNLLLMNGNDLWFYANSTSRPIRITPIQRLSGATSFGDLASLSWSKDYKIEHMEEIIIIVKDKPIKSYVCNLIAKSSGATYQKVQLWIDKKNHQPIKSKVFLTSGKLYKTLDFTKYEVVSGKMVNSEIVFTDNFNKQKKSILKFMNFKEERSLPNRYFIKTMLSEVSNELYQ